MIFIAFIIFLKQRYLEVCTLSGAQTKRLLLTLPGRQAQSKHLSGCSNASTFAETGTHTYDSSRRADVIEDTACKVCILGSWISFSVVASFHWFKKSLHLSITIIFCSCFCENFAKCVA